MTENDTEGSSIQSTVQSGNGQSNITDETENNECDTAINGNLKTIHMKPQVHEKYDLSLFLQGKRANVLKNLEKGDSNGLLQYKCEWCNTDQMEKMNFLRLTSEVSVKG